MDEIKVRLAQLLKAYDRLKYMRTKYIELSSSSHMYNTQDTENELIAHRDSLIKRFEFCYDLTWKFLKLLLKKQYSIDVNSPRKVFHESYAQGLLTTEESASLLEMIDSCNEASHIYDENLAQSISQKIIHYYNTLAKLAEKFQI